MALNFPTSPSTGDVHQASNSLSYFFDGVKWITQGTYNTGTINAVKLDSLTSSFNGSLTTFNLTSNNIAVKPANAQSVQISLGNVIQEPVTAYTINSVQGTITFASAPASNTAFFGIVFSRLPIETTVTNVSDGVITDIKIASNAAIAQSKLNISDATTSASGFMSSTDKTKLDGIESNATADQTNEEIQDIVGAMVSGNTESGITVTYQDSDGTLDFSVASQTDNNFTDADHTKLDGIEASATADQTAAEIRALVESASDSNVFTDADHTKLNGIEASATADQTASEIVALLSGQNITTGDFTISSATPILNLTETNANPDYRLLTDGGEFVIQNDQSGSFATKFKIQADGQVNIGGAQFYQSNNVAIPIDGAEFKLGAGDDLKLYHNGTDTYIDNTNGELFIKTTTKFNLRSDGNEAMIVATPNGAVELKYDNSTKFETTSGGATVTGTTTSNYLTLSAVNPSITFTDTNDNPDFKLESNSGQFKIIDTTNSADRLIVQSSGAIDVQSNLTAVSSSSVPALTAKGDGSSQDGYIQLNCSQNSHGVKIKAPPHSAAASYTLTLPDTDGSANQVLKTDGNGNLDWVNQSSGGGGSSIGGDTGVDFNDSVKARFGTGNDLEIYHNGTDTYIDNTNGELFIKTTTKFNLRSDGNEAMIVATPNGAVELKYDNSTKLQTASHGVTVTGQCFVSHSGTTAAFSCSDNGRSAWGSSNDLVIYHSGTASFISNITACTLLLQNEGNIQFEAKSGEDSCKMIPHGGVELYYDNSKKFETTNTGAKVTGADLTVIGTEGISAGLYLIADEGDDNGDGWRLNSNQDDNDLTIANNISGSYVDKLTLQNDGDLFTTGDVYLKNDSKKLKFGASDDLEIYHDGSDSYIDEVGTGSLYIRGEAIALRSDSSINLRNAGNSENMLRAFPDGAVELYYDNSKKLETTNVGINVTGNVDLTAELNLTGGSDAQRFIDAAVGTSALTFRGCTSGDANHQEMARFFRGGACELNHAGTKKLETASGGVTITGLLTTTAANLETGEFGMTTASGTPQSRFMDFGFLNNALNMRRTNGGEAGHTNFLTVASSLTVSGDLNDTSDEKLKKNIASIADGAIAIIKQLRPVTFDWIDENRNNNVSGFIAQEVKTVLPNLVYGTEYDPSLVDETKGSKGGIKSEGYSVNTVGITAHLTKALQEAIAKIEILETKVATLEGA